MTDSTCNQHPGLRLILIVANTVAAIFAAINGRFMILISLVCLLTSIFFDTIVFYYQTQSQYSQNFNSLSLGGHIRVESTADQVDEAATQHTDDEEDSHEHRKAKRTNWLIFALDVLATFGYTALHILISLWMSGRDMLVFEINMICLLSA